MIPFARISKYGNIAPDRPTLSRVQSSNNATFLLLSDGRLYNRGTYTNGNLGNSTSSITGDWLLTNSNVSQMWYYVLSCLVKKNDGTWWCTGNRQYLIGSSAQTNVWYDCTSLMSTIDNAGSSIKKLLYSNDKMFCLLNDGRIISSGLNPVGVHGTGNTTAITSPTFNSAYNSLGTWVDITFNGASFYALRDDGVLYGSGNSSVGQLVGTTSSSVPKLLTTDVLHICAGNSSLTISKSDGIYVLGSQFQGQIGDGVATSDTAAVGRTAFYKLTTPAGLDATDINTGNYMTLIRKSDGTYMCTGNCIKGSVGSNSSFSVYNQSLNVPAHTIPWCIGNNQSYIIGSDGILYGTGAYSSTYDPLPGYTTAQYTFVPLSLRGIE